MRTLKAFLLLLVLAACAGAWAVGKYRISGLGGLSLSRGQPDGQMGAATPLPPAKGGETIRIASFNIQVFGTDKMQNRGVVEVLARIVRQFDIVAIQEIRSQEQDLLDRFVRVVNADGRAYDYVIGERLGTSNSKEQYAFIFDLASVEIDRSKLYTLQDNGNYLHREPLVGWFRCRGPAPDEAFTFSLVNIHTDPDVVLDELNVLDDAMFAIRDDGRNEDDVILLGDFNADDQNLGELGAISGLRAAIVNTFTNTRQTAQYDNIVFLEPATREYIGRSGVLDFWRAYNLTEENALLVSDHMPVWAEFSVFEGGRPSRMAGNEAPVRVQTSGRY